MPKNTQQIEMVKEEMGTGPSQETSLSKQMKFNGEFKVAVGNEMIKARQSMSLQCAKILRILIAQIGPKDSELKSYQCKIKDLAEFLGVDSSNIYRSVRKICEDLLNCKVKIGTGNPKEPWKMFQWVSIAEYDGAGTLTLKLSEPSMPYVLALKEWYTTNELDELLYFPSFYSLRLYEYLVCLMGEKRALVLDKESVIFLTLQELRDFFELQSKFAKISQFKERVLDQAVRDINDLSYLAVSYDDVKKGKSIVGFNFTLKLVGVLDSKRDNQRFIEKYEKIQNRVQKQRKSKLLKQAGIS